MLSVLSSTAENKPFPLSFYRLCLESSISWMLSLAGPPAQSQQLIFRAVHSIKNQRWQRYVYKNGWELPRSLRSCTLKILSGILFASCIIELAPYWNKPPEGIVLCVHFCVFLLLISTLLFKISCLLASKY